MIQLWSQGVITDEKSSIFTKEIKLDWFDKMDFIKLKKKLLLEKGNKVFWPFHFIPFTETTNIYCGVCWIMFDYCDYRLGAKLIQLIPIFRLSSLH